ncbi:MAG: MBOAT family protein [Bacteroidota bacterium]|nr:MBOAT family protein [Bacteroidota bacterium]
MVFTSFNFLVFFPVLIIVYYIIPVKLRPSYLLIASYYFYINLKPVYALLLVAITLTTYLFTRLIEKTKSEKGRTRLLTVNIILILLPLFFFKYYNFVNAGAFNLLNTAGIRWPLPEISWILPIGISFYTFMAIGYSVDVYNSEIEAEKNLGILALFLAFFPIILSGPIERATNMFQQFKSKILFSAYNIEKGFQLMLWGYFMKLVIADRIAILNHAILDYPGKHSGISLLMAVLLYPIQVYGDLGGYSLIAIGAAKMMGYNVMANFKQPFFATSMSDFWRRWHISLISWITDYIYLPLSYNLRRFKMWGIIMALMLTFIIAGIWHGAGSVFIIWGILQGTFLSVEALTGKSRMNFVNKYGLGKKNWYIFLCMLFTYFLFASSELFGGSTNSTHDAFFVIKKIVTSFSGAIYYNTPSTMLFIIIGILFLFFVDFKNRFHKNVFSFLDNVNPLWRNFSYAFLIIMILLMGVFDGGQFIYFKF